MSGISRHDVLIAGGGLAGLRAAVQVHDAGRSVAVVSKVYPIRSHSGAAQGGVNASLGNHPDGGDDSWEGHAFDTIKGSDYLADQPRAEILAQDAPVRVLEMEHWGAYFSRFPDGRIAQRPFGGAGFPRTCYAADRTGHQLLHTLWEQCLKRGITFLDEWFVTRIVTHDGRAGGVVALHVPTGELRAFAADVVLIAGGGYGRVFAKTTNAYINTGSLTAAAYRAGARLEDMEFIQFHPTTLYGTNILMTEGVRGEGGYLVNVEGKRFMDRYAPSVLELAPRDIVARAIQTEVDEGRGFEGGYVQLDIRHLGGDVIKEKLPGIRQIAMDFAGVDPIEEPIPVQPGQHYSMGGVSCDENGETDVPGLLAAGECSCVSVHGANRLGGNSLLETLVFGKRAGDRAAEIAGAGGAPDASPADALADALAEERGAVEALRKRTDGERQIEIRRDMQRTMTEKVGLFRDGARCADAVREIARLRTRYRRVALGSGHAAFNYDLIDTLELRGMLELAEITALGALVRQESRGSHWRTDHPKRDDTNWLKHTMATRAHWRTDHPKRDDTNWLKHTMATRGKGGQPVIDYEDVVMAGYEPTERTY